MAEQGPENPSLGEVVQERATEVLDKVTDAAATGVEKAAAALPLDRPAGVEVPRIVVL